MACVAYSFCAHLKSAMFLNEKQTNKPTMSLFAYQLEGRQRKGTKRAQSLMAKAIENAIKMLNFNK